MALRAYRYTYDAVKHARKGQTIRTADLPYGEIYAEMKQAELVERKRRAEERARRRAEAKG